jgi:hypothetical protein
MNMQFHVPRSEFRVRVRGSGSTFRVRGSTFVVRRSGSRLGSWFLVPGSWFLVLSLSWRPMRLSFAATANREL